MKPSKEVLQPNLKGNYEHKSHRSVAFGSEQLHVQTPAPVSGGGLGMWAPRPLTSRQRGSNRPRELSEESDRCQPLGSEPTEIRAHGAEKGFLRVWATPSARCSLSLLGSFPGCPVQQPPKCSFNLNSSHSHPSPQRCLKQDFQLDTLLL